MEKTQQQKDCPHDQGFVWCECKLCGWYDRVAGANRIVKVKNDFRVKYDTHSDKTFVDNN